MNNKTKNRIKNFDLNPVLNISNTSSTAGYEGITKKLIEEISKSKSTTKTVIVFDYHFGVDEKKMFDCVISKLNSDVLIDTINIKHPEKIVYEKIKSFIAVEGEAGQLSPYHIEEFFDDEKLQKAKSLVENSKGLIIIYGVAASIVSQCDILVYCSVDPSTTVPARFAKGLDNWGVQNYDEDPAKKTKRFNCVDQRALEWHKRELLNDIDYMIDCNNVDNPVMVCGNDFRKTLDSFIRTPFKMVPFFTPGVWGGHWCKDVLGADKSFVNTAWAIIGIVDFQCVKAQCGDNVICFPAKDILLYKPIEFLGHHVFFWFGYKCPITMDYLDTWGGGNLSLQVHPTIAYNHEIFNYPFAHNESYYVMDTTDHSSVYMGTKTGVKLDELIQALREAQKTGKFDDTKYINKWPVKKHDHLFIPSGTIHSSGKDTLVLEIDTTFISTFKLWDWDRLDLNGKPRPISIDHGAQVIQECRQTDYVKNNLISKGLEVDRGDGWRKEHSGTMDYEMLTVDRYWFTKTLFFETKDLVKMHCLVEGNEAIIESPNNEFEPVILHYAEAIVIPAAIGQYTIKPHDRSEGQELAVLECYMSFGKNSIYE